MNIKKELINFKNNNPWVLWIWNEYRRIKGNIEFKKISDKEYTKKLYFNAFGKYPDLDNPKTFNEKIQWMKLNYKNKNITQLSDKYEVRQYIEEKGYGYLLNDLIAVYDFVDDINIDELPNKFVLKACHGSGWNLIVKNKDKIKWTPWKLVMKSWMKQNLYYYGREWNYKDIKPRIICEKFLEDNYGELRDYKIFCFNGEPKIIQVDVGRFTNHCRNVYDCEWNMLPLKLGYENYNGNVEKPINLVKMLDIAKDLSKELIHVRVDFYEVKERLYFGELTFFHESGTSAFVPNKYDKIIGDYLELPNENYCL